MVYDISLDPFSVEKPRALRLIGRRPVAPETLKRRFSGPLTSYRQAWKRPI